MMSSAAATPNRQNLMVDLSQAIAFVQEIYAAVDPHVAASIFEALARFEQNSDTPGEIEKLATVLKRNLKGHRDLLEKFDFYFPKKHSLLRPRSPQGSTVPNQSTQHANASPVPDVKDETAELDLAPPSPAVTEARTPYNEEQSIHERFFQLEREVGDEASMRLFLQCFHAYNTGDLTRQQFLEKIPTCIKESQTYGQELMQYLDAHPNDNMKDIISSYQNKISAQTSTPYLSPFEMQLELKIRNLEKLVGDSTIFGTAVESIKRYSKGEADLMWLKAILLDELQHCSDTAWTALRELLHEFDKIQGLDKEGRACLMIDLRRIVSREEDLQQVALDETDLQSFERCTPSYVKLPQHCVTANKKTLLAREVLNDRLKSCSIGTEDTESQERHNMSEFKMAMMETEMWTAELSINRLKSLIKNLERLNGSLANREEADAKAFLRAEGLGKSALHTATLKILYKSEYDRLLEAVYENPKIGVQTVMESAKRKLHEWEQAQRTRIPEWREICHQHHQRSLDFTCQIFQDNEKRELSFSAQLSEIKKKCKNEKKTKNAHCDVTDLQDELSRPHLTFHFKNRNAVRLCSWGIVKGIHTRLKSAQIPISSQFWESFLSLFLDAGADDTSSDPPENPPSPMPQLLPFDKAVQSTLIPKTENSTPPGVTEEESEMVIYCDEQFYHMFRLFHILYTRFDLLSDLLAKCRRNGKELEKQVLDLISSSLIGSIETDEYEEELVDLLGKSAFPLFSLVDVIDKTVSPMRTLWLSDAMRLFHRAIAVRSCPDGALSEGLTLKEHSVQKGKRIPSVDVLRYLLEARESFPQHISFRIGYNSTKHLLSLRHLQTDVEKLPQWENRIIAGTTGASGYYRDKRNPIFLRRSLTAACLPSKEKDSKWPRYASFTEAKLQWISTRRAQSSRPSKARLQRLTGPHNKEEKTCWMVSLQRNPSMHVQFVEKKTLRLLSWLRGRLAAMSNNG